MKNVTTKKTLIVSVILAVIITGCSVNKPDQQAAKDSNVELNNALINEEITKIINEELVNKPPASGGKTYYVCDSDGNDLNLGQSKLLPLKTFDKAMSKFGELNGGDEIAFCRGGSFSVLDYKALFNTKTTGFNPIKIKDYYKEGAIGDEPRPIITSLNGGVFYFNTRKSSQELPDGGVVIENLILKGSENNTSIGIFLLNGFSEVKINNVAISNFRVGVSVAGGANESRDIHLTNSAVYNNKEQGWLGGGGNLKILNNLFQNNGFNGPHNSYFYHNVYVSNSSGTPANDVLISGNTLYQSALVEGKCGGASLVVHGEVNDLIIENNLIKEDKGKVTQFCYGLGVGPAYSTAEAFKNVIIRKNTLINMGRVGISGGSLIGAIIENNTIVDESSILDEGILVPDGEDRYIDDAKSKNVTINDNLIYANHASARGISVAGTFPYTVQNNKISLLVTSIENCIKKLDANKETDTSSNACLNHNNPDLVTTLIETGFQSEEFNPEETSEQERMTSEDSTSEDSTSEDSTSEDSTSEDSTSEDSTSEDSTSEDSTSEDSTSEGSTSEGSTSEGSTSEGSTSEGSKWGLKSTAKSGSKSRGKIGTVTVYDYKKSKSILDLGGYEGKCRAKKEDGTCLMI